MPNEHPVRVRDWVYGCQQTGGGPWAGSGEVQSEHFPAGRPVNWKPPLASLGARCGACGRARSLSNQRAERQCFAVQFPNDVDECLDIAP